MLSKKIQTALNSQIAHEAYASNYYLAMASWCEMAGLPGSAKFMYASSAQESEHKMKLFKYVNEAGGHALVSEVEKPPHQYKTLANVLELVLKHERQVTKLITKLVDDCLKEKDYSTFNFLQWYVAEQHEEERRLKLIFDLIQLAGTGGRGIFFIDKEIGKIVDREKAK